MKIPLNVNQNGSRTTQSAAYKVLEQDVLAAKQGDWKARQSIERTLLPLLTSLAEKRTDDPAKQQQYIDAAKEGIGRAAKKYKPSIGADHFRIFALDFIEAAMNRVDGQGGFWGRLFGK